MSSNELMRRVQMLSFVLTDVNLYLDTHPTDKAALSFFNKYNALHKSAVADYEKNYGPITITGTNDTSNWSWVDEPWPWQREA